MGLSIVDMKKVFISVFAVLLCLTVFAQSPKELEVKTFTLSNGMEVWINEDHGRPSVFGAIVVKAGAKDCPGTGIAHYFEHIMFKGTEKIGTFDYTAEKPLLDSISALYDRLAMTQNDSVRMQIQLEINRLNIKASEYAIPNEFDNLISECGGSDLNAFTSPDITVYHNQFVPSFLEQWAELNSERLIDPVFRLFQSELETVYEEKNMSDNEEMSSFQKMILSEGFKGSPYQFEVIGTTENLKNPQLSRMREFFEQYYVAGNMGLILTGDISPSSALPILEKTFGRIRAGIPQKAEISPLQPFVGRNEVSALVNIPFVKLQAICFRAPSKKDADCLPLGLVAFMLNNSEGIGMLDKLTTDRKLMAAMCMYPSLAMNESGLFPILVMPKLVFQSNKKAEQLVMDVLDRLKAGDFSDDFFKSCKLSYIKNLYGSIESIEGRMQEMIDAYSINRKWEDVVADIDRLDALTKEEVVSLANRYLSDNYLVITKKYGNPEMEHLAKPPYEKVAPKYGTESSEYAKQIKEEVARVKPLRPVVDFDKDVTMTKLYPYVNFYSTENKLNDIFELKISYPVSAWEYPAIGRMTSYLNTLGTETYSYDDFRAKLQALGGSLDFSMNYNGFNVNISGFDRNFEDIISLAGNLLTNPKGNRKMLSLIKEDETMSKIFNKRDAAALSNALLDYVRYGQESSYLVDKGKIDDDTLLGLFETIKQVECDVIYSGSLSHEDVAEVIKSSLPLDSSVSEHPYRLGPDLAIPEGRQVFFLPKKGASQTRIYAVVQSDVLTDLPTRYASSLYGDYFGGGMSSVLFQEIREYRSLAYNTGSVVGKPSYVKGDSPAYQISFIGTQCDKTIEAMTVLDSLLMNLPKSEKRAGDVRKSNWNSLVTNYPNFRGISSLIVDRRRCGYESDPSSVYYDLLNDLSFSDIETFWKEHIAGRDVIWVVVGDPKRIDMEEIRKFGDVRLLKAKDVIR